MEIDGWANPLRGLLPFLRISGGAERGPAKLLEEPAYGAFQRLMQAGLA